MAEYLRKAGHTVRCLPTGREALSALMEKLPDVILLDVLMPGMDGIAVLEVLRSYLRWATVPVGMLTAYPEDPRLRQLEPLGVKKVFAKSKVNLDELLDWVNDQAGRATPPPAGNQPGSQAGA